MITRRKGKTFIDLGNVKIITNMINRFRYNNLRKLDVVTRKDVYLAIRKSLLESKH